MMTDRERILTILRGGQPDRVPWFGDLDYWANALIRRALKPQDFIWSDEYIQWHRDLRVGFYLQGYSPFKQIYPDCGLKIWSEGNRKFTEFRTPLGNVRDCWEYIPTSFCEAPIEHFIKSEADLPIMKFIYENSVFEPDYERAACRCQQVGDVGIVLCYLPKSPFMHCVVMDAGIEMTTVLALTAPDEFEDLLGSMKKAFDQAARIAVDSPAEALMIPENLSSEMVGPDFFERYMRGYQSEWVRKIKEAGKYSFVHMDGTLAGLLRQQASVNFTVLEALTPQPVGDLKIDDFRTCMGDSESIVWGGIPGSYFTANVGDEEFDRHVEHVISVMRRTPKFVLGVADQVPPDALERRVRRVADLVDECGTY